MTCHLLFYLSTPMLITPLFIVSFISIDVSPNSRWLCSRCLQNFSGPPRLLALYRRVIHFCIKYASHSSFEKVRPWTLLHGLSYSLTLTFLTHRIVESLYSISLLQLIFTHSHLISRETPPTYLFCQTSLDIPHSN